MRFIKRISIKINVVVKIFFTAAFISFIAASSSFAVPASPDFFEEEQPDGERITLRMQGDEFYGWTEDEQGYTVIRDTSTREWFYAEMGRDGNLQKSRHRVGRGTRPDMFGIPKNLKKRGHEREAEENRRRMQPADNSSAMARDFFTAAAVPQGPSEADAPAKTWKHLVILVEFSDKKFTLANPKKEFEDFFNQKGYSKDSARGSVKDYYDEVSYGALNVESIVTDVFTLSKTNAYYTGSRYDNVQEMVREAFALVNATGFDFTQLPATNNTPPFITFVTIVHAGAGMEAGGDSLWSHKWQLNGAAFITHDNRRLYTYNTIPELRGNGRAAPYQITTIGVSCHELGHAMLNLPDLYDTKSPATHSGVGRFCLMGNGSWGSVGASGNSPAHMSAWCKKYAGFANPIELTSNGYYSINRSALDKNSFYKFGGPSFDSREYFLIENRQGTGFDASLPGSSRGILMWHIDERRSNNETAAYLKVCLEEADGTSSLTTGTGRSGSDSSYFRTGNKTEFTDDTTPNSKSYTSQLTGKPITEISASGPTMTFRVGSGGATLVSAIINAITPTESRVGTNVVVAINGANFLAGSTAKLVREGSTINANSLIYNSSSSLTATFNIPGGAAPGYYDLVLSHSEYVIDVTKEGFLVLGNMAINNVTPAMVTRGTTVNLAVTGAGFQNGATMVLDSNSLIINGTNITHNGTTGITGTFVIPPTAGNGIQFTLTITNPSGDYVKKTQAVTSYSELTITSFSPASAAAGSSVNLTVNGSNFRDAARIILRNASNESQTIMPDTALVSASRVTGTFTAPSSSGTWKVYVAAYDGGPEYAAASTLSITGSSARIIDTITPSESKRGTNNVSVTINGMNFLSGSTAKLIKETATITANSVTYNSSSRLTAIFNIPSTAAVGYYDLAVSSSGYSGDITKTGIFLVLGNSMAINNVTPDIGIIGTTLKLTAAGTDIQSGAAIKLVNGSTVINGTGITQSGTTAITASFAIPPGAANGTKFNLTVTNPSGDYATKTQAVTAYNALTVTSFTPLQASTGTVNLAVNGTGFINGYSKIILKNASNESQTITPSITSISATQIAGTFTASSSGTWKVYVVAYDNGPEYAAASNMIIRVLVNGTINTITPASSKRNVTASVEINGTNLLPGSTAKLVRGTGTITANSVTYNSSTKLTASFAIPSAAASGYWDLTVSSAGYVSDITKTGIFFIQGDMSINNVTPDIGIRGTTLKLTVTGTDFQSGAAIKLVSGGMVITGTGVTYSGTTAITASFALPSSIANGTKFYLTVTNPSGDAVTKMQAVTVYNALTVTSFTPLTANTGNTVNLTVNGAGFINGYSKIILKNALNSQTITPSITSVNATQIAGTFTAPVSTGTWKVCVTAYDNGPEYAAASNMSIWNVTAHNLFAYEGREITFPVISKNGAQNTGKMIIPERTFSEDVTIQVHQHGNLAQAQSYVRELKHTNIGVNIDAQGKKPEREIELRIPYNESDITEVNEVGLVISRYDEEKNTWVPLKSKADNASKQIIAYIDHLSVFAIMGTANAAQPFEDVKYYPNPMQPSKGLNYSRMHFSNMPSGTRIKIYTMMGQTVRELESDASGMAVWDGQNNTGEKVASGVYIVYMEDRDGNKKRIKVAVER